MNTFKELFDTSARSQEEGVELMKRLMDVARPEGVFGQPVTVEGQTVITAAEVSLGMGFGFGGGGSPGTEPAGDEADAPATPAAMGSGAGGGGGASGRPVAAIIINQQGVRIEPIVDPTKIALALFTTLGSMFLMFGRMRRAAK